MNKPMVLCEKGYENGDSIFCEVSDELCCCIRWCYTDERVKNSESYVNCKNRNIEMSKKQTKAQVKVETTETNKEFKEGYFPILWKKEHAFAVEFFGYGLSFHTKEENYLDTSFLGNEIKMRYTGEIGNEGFEIYPVYE